MFLDLSCTTTIITDMGANFVVPHRCTEKCVEVVKKKKTTSKRFYDRFDTKLLAFHGNEGEHFRWWELRLKVVLDGKEIAEALVGKELDKKTSERVLAAVISVLSYSPHRTIQHVET